MTASEKPITNNPATTSQEEVSPASSPSQQPSNIRWYAIGGVVFLVLLGGIFLFKNNKSNTDVRPNPSQQVGQPATITTIQPTKPRSKAPGIIGSVVTTKALDTKTGYALNPTTSFATTDKTIYLVLTVNTSKVGTKFEYVRSLNGKFLDNRSITLIKPVNVVSFDWRLKKVGATHLPGTYKVKVYTNGVFEKEISYSVQ